MFASPITSSPDSASGHAWLWIGVGAANPLASSTSVTHSGNAASKNVRAGAGSARRPRGPPVTRTRCWWRQSRTSRSPKAATAGCSW